MKKIGLSLILCASLLCSSTFPVMAMISEGSFVPCAVKQSADNSRVSVYRIKKGDTLWEISRALKVDVETLMMINQLNQNSILVIGQTLEIPYSNARIHIINQGETLWQIAARYGIGVKELQSLNQQINPNKLKIGDRITLPNNARKIQEVKQEPSRGLSIGSSIFAWPLMGTITSPYGWRKSGFHHGLDIAGKIGDPIKASAAGTVSFAGYKNIYGNMVILDHPNGHQTVYAHANEIYVKKGQTVSKGKIIAAVGTSGRTTGPHLHFEIRVGEKTFNPLQYLR